jgi:hypothetical protein
MKRVTFNNIVEISYFNKNEPVSKKSISNFSINNFSLNNTIFYIIAFIALLILINLLL